MRLVVTDLTRFSNRDKVCLAGIDLDTGACIRPLVEKNGKNDYISFDGVKEHKVIPGSILEGDFVPVPGSAVPHSEDHRVIGKLSVKGAASSDDFESILDRSSVPTVRSGFGHLPENRLYSTNNPPGKSIITLKLTSPRTQFRMSADKYNNEKFKAHLVDASGFRLEWLPVTDLGFSDHIQSIRNDDPDFARLNLFLQAQRVLYIRLGLARQYANPNNPERDGYWVQVNGIYSFPNYRQDLRIYE